MLVVCKPVRAGNATPAAACASAAVTATSLHRATPAQGDNTAGVCCYKRNAGPAHPKPPPPSPGPSPGLYRCVNQTCVVSKTGVDQGTCNDMCEPLFSCLGGTCTQTIDGTGVNMALCQTNCPL